MPVTSGNFCCFLGSLASYISVVFSSPVSICGRLRSLIRSSSEISFSFTRTFSKVFIRFSYFDIVCNWGYDDVEELDFVDTYSGFSKRFEKKMTALAKCMCLKMLLKKCILVGKHHKKKSILI